MFRWLDFNCPNPYKKTMRTNSVSDLSVQQLKQALAIKEKIEVLANELNNIWKAPNAASAAPAPGRRRTMSAAARARIAAAQRARWARVRGTAMAVVRPSASPVRMISAAGRARLAEAARKRWAKAKRMGKTSLSA